MMSEIILDLCGGTGAWSQPYADAGYDVRIVTLPDQDILTYEPPEKVHGILFAPPCTVWAASGARWWKSRSSDEVFDAIKVLMAGLRIIRDCKPVWYAIENPVGKMRQLMGDPALIFNPCDYGDPYTKKTLLWGKFNLPVKTPVEPTEGSKMHLYPPSSARATLRSITPPGFAKAFFEANP